MRQCFLALAIGLASLLLNHSVGAQAPTVNVNSAQHVLITIKNRPEPGMRRAGSTWRGWAWTGAYNASVTTANRIDAIAKEYSLTLVDQWTITLLGEHCIVFKISDGQTRAEVLARLGSDRRVSIAQPLNMFEMQSTAYNDTLYDAQYSAGVLQLSLAHDFATGKNIQIALIDTGVSLRHPDLVGQVSSFTDFTLVKERPNTDRHGTAMAGLMVAKGNNSVGIVGVAPDATLHVLKACWSQGEDNYKAYCNSFTLSRAIGAAVANGSDLVNMSLSGPDDPLLTRLVMKLLERGIPVIGAMPESVPESGQVTSYFPSSIPGVIAVRTSSGVQTGLNAGAVAAPGIDALTTAPPSNYDYHSGSSVATAHVSGVVALIKQHRPQLSPDAIEVLLRNAVLAGGTPNNSSSSDSLNACLAVAGALNNPRMCDSENP